MTDAQFEKTRRRLEKVLPHFRGNLSLAVFNCQDHEKRKGRQAVLSKFGPAGWQKVLRCKRTGIMEIFQHEPTPETRLYAETIAKLADARCGKKKGLVKP